VQILLGFRVPLVLAILVGWTAPTSAQANDNRATPTMIAMWPFSNTVDASTATSEASDPVHSCSSSNGSQSDNNSVWYSFTPDAAGIAVVDIRGTTYKTVVSVHTSSSGALTEVACRFLPSPGSFKFTAEAGTTYLIEVTDWYGDGPGGGILHFWLNFLNWKFKAAPNPDHGLNKIRIDPDDDNLWYVGSTANGLYLTRDGGDSWQHQLSGLTWGLFIDPTNTNRIYAGSTNNLYRSDNKGHTWSLIKAFPTDESIYSILVSPIDGAIFVGMHWNSSTPNGLYKSLDQGLTWTLYPFNIPALSYAQDKGLIIWDIAEDPVNGFLYLGTEPQSKPPTSSTCAPWSICYDPPTLRSQDRGQTWQDVSGTKGSPGALDWHATRIQVHPTTQDVYFQVEGGSVFTSHDFGASWEILGNDNSWDLLIDRNNPARFFGGGIGGGVWLSTDIARSFIDIGPIGLANPSVIHVALNRASTRIYVSYSNLAQPGGVYVADLSRARNFAGKISLVQTTSAGTRFFVRPQSLSLFATGDYRDVLLEAFFHKSSVSVGYTAITCPGSITGTCGNVTFASVDVSNLTH
jgi:hypothetical protein